MPKYPESNIVSLEDALKMRNAGQCHLTYSMPGKQTDFLSTSARRCIYGGGVSGGKTRGLQLQPVTKLLTIPGYNAVIARQSFPQLNQPGGLIKDSHNTYLPLGATYHGTNHEWTFPNHGNTLKFMNIGDISAVEGADGSQFSFLGIDEAQHWDENVVEALWVRARGLSGARTQLCMTCNPKKKSWMIKWISPYIDDRGFPIQDMSGVVIQYMRGHKGELVRFPTEMDALIWWRRNFPDQYKLALDDPDLLVLPESFTFISSLATDNTVMMEGDPDYRSKLMNQPAAIRKAKFEGCWFFDEEEGDFFRTEWVGDPLKWYRRGREFFSMGANGTEKLEATITRACRAYDFAYVAKTDENDPDWTTGTLICELSDKRILVADHKFMRDGAGAIQKFIEDNAAEDPEGTEISIPADPAGGVGFSFTLIRDMPGLNIVATPEAGAPKGSIHSAKEHRFMGFSRQCQSKGAVRMLHDKNAAEPWNERWCMYLAALGTVESKKKKDDCDSTSRAYNHLCGQKAAYDIFDLAD